MIILFPINSYVTKTMQLKYNQYDIVLSKASDGVTIRIVDNNLFKTYEKTIDKMSMFEHGIGTIDNLYIIHSECMKHFFRI